MLRNLLRVNSLRRMRPSGRGGGQAEFKPANPSEMWKRYEKEKAVLFPGNRTKDGAFRMDATEYAFTFGTILALVLPLWMWASAEYSNNPSDWALDEAEERFRRRAKGLPVEYGENYAGMKSNGYLKNNTVEELVEARQSIEASATPLTDFINAARSRKANASD